MSIIKDIYRQRVAFLRENKQPNRVLVPYDMKFEFLGEVVCSYPGSALGPDNLHVMGLKVIFTRDVKRVEVALVHE